TGDEARVVRVAVELKHQGRLAGRVVEERLDIGVRATLEVRDVNQVQVAMAASHSRRGQNAPSRIPVHIGVDVTDVFGVQGQEIHGQNVDPIKRPQLAQDVAVDTTVVEVVRPPDQ